MKIYQLCKVVEGFDEFPNNDERSFGYYLTKQKAESHPEYRKYLKEETIVQKKKARYAAHWKAFSEKEKIAYYTELSSEDVNCTLYWYIREINVND